jgi:phospholipid transport system substrate-binding protein
MIIKTYDDANEGRGLGRRALFGLMIAAIPFSHQALAEFAPADAVATIKHFNTALLAAMKSGGQNGFNQRFQALAPAVDQAFDLRTVLATSVGSGWSGLAPNGQSQLLDAFRRYTVASYVANFDSYSG